MEWTQGRYSAVYGQAGGITLFTYCYATDRAKIEAGFPYTLTTDLPGYRGRVWHVESPEAAKAKADRLLAAWLKLVAPAPRAAPVEASSTAHNEADRA